MYTLYGMGGACSMAVHVLLNELGQKASYVEVRTPAGEPKSPALLKVNPRGNVPVLVEGDHIMREGGAILAYLMDKHGMLPKDSTKRADALEWLMFGNSTMHPAYSKLFGIGPSKVDDAAKEELTKAALEKINSNWKEVDAQLAKTGAFITGDKISGADILLTVIANWAQDSFGSKITLGENTKRLIKSVISRPSYQQALTDEGVTYKAAA